MTAACCARPIGGGGDLGVVAPIDGLTGDATLLNAASACATATVTAG